jgi:phage shock protein C
MELTTAPPHTTEPAAEPTALRRATEGRMLAGVAAGLADYFDVDVAIVRVVLVALAVLGGLGVPLYVAAWLLIPEEGSDDTVADDLLEHLRHH